jgi:hypothetical protein
MLNGDGLLILDRSDLARLAPVLDAGVKRLTERYGIDIEHAPEFHEIRVLLVAFRHAATTNTKGTLGVLENREPSRMSPMTDWPTTAEVAQELQIGQRAVTQARKRGRLKACKDAQGRYRYDSESIGHYSQSRKGKR